MIQRRFGFYRAVFFFLDFFQLIQLIHVRGPGELEFIGCNNVIIDEMIVVSVYMLCVGWATWGDE